MFPFPSCALCTAVACSLSSLAWSSAQPSLAGHRVKQQLQMHKQMAVGVLANGTDRCPSCPDCSAPLCQENQVMNKNISHPQRYYLTYEPLASWELGNHGRHCGNTLPGKPHCAPTWVSDTCHLLTLMCEVLGGKQLTWVEEKPPLGFC